MLSMSQERDDSGQFVEQVTLEDVLGALRRVDGPMTGTELGERVGISNRAALNKLNTLHDRGDVRRKEVGGRSVVWWLPDEERAVSGIDPEDGFWNARPGSSAEPTDAATADEHLADALGDE
jgi:hypothetical protein